MDHPEAFYKYLSPRAAEAVLTHGRLRWSSPLLFDDPAEFKRMPRFSPSLTEGGGAFVQILVNAATGAASFEENRLSDTTRLTLNLMRRLVASGIGPEELLSQLGEIATHPDDRFEAAMQGFVQSMTLQATRILCVTTDGANDEMWNTYADQRRGVVLKLRHIPEESTPLLAAKQIAYSADRPTIGSGLEFLLFGDTPDLRRRGLNSIVYTKRIEWSYQREWRAVTWRTDEGESLFGDYPFLDAELVAVTAGRQAPEAWVSNVHAFVKARYPECVFMRDEGQINGELGIQRA